MNNRIHVIGVYLLIFLHMLDTTVANLLLVRMAPDLGVDVQESTWIITAFGTGILTSFGFAGLAGRRFGVHATFFWGNVGFLVASLSCGVAPESYSFFLARLLQGFTSGLVVNVSFPILLGLFKDRSPAVATAVWVSAISLAPVVGPIYGALLSEIYGWRWVFLLNAPLIAIALLPLTSHAKPVPGTVDMTRSFAFSLASYAIAAATFQFAIDMGTQNDWRFDAELTGLCVLCIAAVIAFVKSNAISGHRVLDVPLLANTRFSGYLFIIGVGTGVIFASTLLLPIWLQLDYGLSILDAGKIVAISSLATAILSPVIGRRAKPQYLVLMATGSLLFVFASFAITSTHTTDSAMWVIFLGRLLLGCGLALFSTSLTTLMMGSGIAQDKVLAATTFNMCARVFASNLFATAAVYAYKTLNQHNYGVYQATATPMAVDLPGVNQAAMLPYVLRIVHTLSMNQVMKCLTLLSLLILLVFAWLQRGRFQQHVAKTA